MKTIHTNRFKKAGGGEVEGKDNCLLPFHAIFIYEDFTKIIFNTFDSIIHDFIFRLGKGSI